MRPASSRHGQGGSSSSRRALLALLAYALSASVLGGGNGARLGEVPSARVVKAPASRAIDQPTTMLSHGRLQSGAIDWTGGPTTASTGETVTVYVSSALPPDAGTPQSWADFIAGLDHGSELSSLTAYVATFEEMQQICGEQALGCYGSNRLLTMGEPADGVAPDEVVRHEYGHHIAAHRLNPPWAAIDWGPKSWASIENVCSRTDDGSAYPGDEGDDYQLNPGEAWAETYRLMEERRAGVTGSGWRIVDESFYPSDAAFQAAQRDVLQPYAAPRGLVFRKSFARKGKRVWTLALSTPLDGSLELDVSLPKGGLYGATLLDFDHKTTLASGLWSSGTTKRITATVCGERTLFLRVTQRGAFGRVRVSATLP